MPSNMKEKTGISELPIEMLQETVFIPTQVLASGGWWAFWGEISYALDVIMWLFDYVLDMLKVWCIVKL